VSIVHAISGEESRLRRASLYLFARYLEMPALGWTYHVLRGRWRRFGANRVLRAALARGVAAPFARLGDTARALPEPEVLQLLDELEGPIAVGPCRCRASHAGCGHPLETDIVIRTGVAAWTRAFPHDYRLVDREEAKAIVARCRRLGMWQMVFVHCPVNEENEYVICNCCTCGCVPYIMNRELGQRFYPLLPGHYRAVTDPALCTGRGDCAAACPFGARAVSGGRLEMVGPCFGCGLCTAACPEAAIRMQHT
jgi:ferredoxin